MKIGTDAMLLGSWAPVPVGGHRRPRILDVGTGTGVLALMMAQKTAAAGNTTPRAGATPITFHTSHSADVAGSPIAIQDMITAGRDGDTASSARTEGVGGVGGGVDAADMCSCGRGGGEALIVAIDVEADACTQAAENAAISPWAERIRVRHISLQDLAAAAAGRAEAGAAGNAANEGQPTAQDPQETAPASAGDNDAAPSAVPQRGAHALPQNDVPAARDLAAVPAVVTAVVGARVSAEDAQAYDLIVSNPPYFIGSSKPAQGRTARASARHADVSLPFADLAAGCAALMAPYGSLCVVLPPAEAARFCEAAAQHGLALVELLRVFTAPEEERERRQLLRLQKAADVEPHEAPRLPRVSFLTIHGPKHVPQQRPQPNQGGPQHPPQHQQSSGASNSQAGPGTQPQLTRSYTQEYAALTCEFHAPAVFIRAGIGAPAAPSVDLATAGG